MIQHFLGTSYSGIYSLSLMIAEILWFIPDSISTILLPVMSGSYNGGKNISFGNTVCRYTIIASTALASIVLIVGISLFTIFTNYQMSLVPFLLLLPGVFLFSICKLLSTLITSNGKLAISNISSSIILFVNISGCFLLIPRLGINGAAIATSLAYLTGTAIAAAYYANLTKSKLSDFLIPRREDLAGISTTFFNILSTQFTSKKI
jgi:O-antigen/teichoic acid export membrane protein